jgi:hypothetical protein
LFFHCTSASDPFLFVSQVGTLLAEIERLKRKALSRGVNLTSPQEDVPAEDVAMLRQVRTPEGEGMGNTEVTGTTGGGVHVTWPQEET